jgi:hypothetical protein
VLDEVGVVKVDVPGDDEVDDECRFLVVGDVVPVVVVDVGTGEMGFRVIS